MIRNAITRHTLAALLLAASLFGVTHFHFPPALSADGNAVVGHSSCGCTHHHHPESPDRPTDSEDCHFCQLLSQLAAELPVHAELTTADLISDASPDFGVQAPVAVASAYLGRGPPEA